MAENIPLNITLLSIFVGGAVGVAILTATCVLYIQRGFSRLESALYRVTTIQRREIDKTLNDHGKRVMRLEWKVFGVTVEGADNAI